MDFVALDVETANSALDSICQIGLAFFEAGELVRIELHLVDPDDWFDGFNVSIHGIDEGAVMGKPLFAELYPWLSGHLDGRIVVTHTGFDVRSISRACEAAGLAVPNVQWLDSAAVARRTWPWCQAGGYGLGPLCKKLGISFRHHDAGEDAAAAGKVLLRAAAEAGMDMAGLMASVRRPITPAFADRLDELSPNENGEYYGQTIVFTGSMALGRIDAARLAAAAGFTVADGVNKTTSLLVVGIQDPAVLAGHEKSSKHRKAEDMQAKGKPIRIVGEADFMVLVGATG